MKSFNDPFALFSTWFPVAGSIMTQLAFIYTRYTGES